MRHQHVTPALTCCLLVFSLLIASKGRAQQADPTPDPGKILFEKNCTKCHGADGTKGFFGAKNLQKSVMTDSAMTIQIQNGKKFMPSFRKKLTPEEIQEVIRYAKTLRKNQIK